MAFSDRLKEYRTISNMTQKDLADKLFVTPQAVSRWENGEVEPSISIIEKLANILNISVNQLIVSEKNTFSNKINIERENEGQEKTHIEPIEKEIKPVLAVCEICNKPIFESYGIVRGTRTLHRHTEKYVHCRSCEKTRLAKKEQEKIRVSKERRNKSFWLGGLAAAVVLSVGLIVAIPTKDVFNIVAASVLPIFVYTFISCLILDNNFIGEMTMDIFSFGFVKMPGLIFTLDLDGILWLITVKLGLFLLSIVIASAFGILALTLGLALSIFVFPFALKKNIINPGL
jgi:transcriptional regulator with XRE-family HTH domain